jgi:hypothetical protein
VDPLPCEPDRTKMYLSSQVNRLRERVRPLHVFRRAMLTL